MADRIIEKHVYHTDSESSGGSSGALMALAVVLMVLVLLAVLYFTGAFHRMFGSNKTKIDINIQKPSAILLLQKF